MQNEKYSGVRYKVSEKGIAAVTTEKALNTLKDKNAARVQLVEYARENFPKTVINQNTNAEIGISRNGIDKFLSGNISKEKYATGYIIPQIIETAKKVGEADNHKGTHGITGYEYYENNVVIDGDNYKAHIRVRNTDMGDKYYGHTISRVVDEIKIEPLARGSKDKSSGHSVNASGSNKSVTQNNVVVKDGEIYSQGKRVTISNKSDVVNGVVVNGESKRMKETDSKGYGVAEKLATSLKKPVKFVKGLYDADGNMLDGIETDNGIFINTEAKNPIKWAATHEFSHTMKKSAGEAWAKYQNFVVDKMKKDGNYYDVFEAKAKAYGTRDANYINEEIAADHIGETFDSVDELADFIKKDRGLAVRVRDFYYKALDKLGLLDEKKKAQLMWRDAYRKAVLNTENGKVESKPETKKSASGTRETDAEAKNRNVVDLSENNELTKRIKGLQGSEKYKAIRDFILETLKDYEIVFNDGIKAIVDKSDALHIANKSANKKTSYISKIKEVIENAELYKVDDNVEHNKFDEFRYYKAEVRLGTEEYSIFLNVGKAKNGTGYHLYDITKKIGGIAKQKRALERVNNDLRSEIDSSPKPTVSQNNPGVKGEFRKSISGTRASEIDSSSNNRYNNGEQFRTMWTIEEGVLSNKEVRQFYSEIQNIANGSEKYTITSEGDYVIEVDNKLVYTDGDFRYPTISKVVTFNVKNQTEFYDVKEFYDDISSATESEELSQSIIEDVYGEGIISRRNFSESQAYARQRGRGKGANSKATDRGTRKSISGTRASELEDSTSSDTEGKFIPPGAEPRRDVKVPESVKEGTKAWDNIDRAAGRELRSDASMQNDGDSSTTLGMTGKDSGARYKISYTTENEPVVVIENDILDGVDKSEWVKTAKETIKKFRPAIPISGRFVRVTKDTGREYTNSGYSKKLRSKDEVRYRDKLTAAGNLDEIVIASTKYVNEGLNHPRTDDIKDFARGNVLLQVGDRKYSADVVIGLKMDESMVLHDIVNITDNEFDIKKETNPKPSTSENRASSRQDSSPTNRVPQNDSSVNSHSMRDGEIYSQGKKVTISESDRVVKNIVLNEESRVFRSKNPKGYKVIETMAQDLGMKVKFVKGLMGGDGKKLDGIITSQGIFIDVESKNPTRWVATHEFTHRMKQTSGKTFQKYKDYVIKQMKKAGKYDTVFEEKAKIYDTRDVDYINEEIAADYISTLFSDVNELADFIRESRREAVTIRDIWYGVLDRLGLRGEKKKAQQLWRDAYRKAVLNKDMKYEGEKNLYAGNRAETANKSLWRQAVEMQKDGASKEDILRETGWFVGRDGKWRFEINDRDAKFDKEGVFDEKREGLLPPGIGVLLEVLQHEKLYEAYPDLQYTLVAFSKNMEPGLNGGIADNDVILLNANRENRLIKSTLIHEVQHLIQRIEGFSEGSLGETIQKKDAQGMLIKDLKNRRDEVLRSLKKEDRKLYEEYCRLGETLRTYPIITDMNRGIREYLQKRDAFENLGKILDKKDWAAKIKKYNLWIENPNLYYEELYYNVAGEVEARDAASRINMTNRERKRNFPYLGDENTMLVEEIYGKSTKNNFLADKEVSDLNSSSESDMINNTEHSLYTDEVIYSSRYNALSQSVRSLYDDAKKGNVESAYTMITKLMGEDAISKIANLGNDVCLLPVVGMEGTSTNVLPRIIADHMSEETGQMVFKGIAKNESSNSRATSVWERMKENYPSFIIDEKSDVKPTDIQGKKFVLIDDNSTTGRTFIGLKNFIEKNEGNVVGYYALTTGQDQSEKMVTTDKTWKEVTNIGLDKVRDFAEKEGIKREISKLGLSERETQELIKRYSNTNSNFGRSFQNDTRSRNSSDKISPIQKKNGTNENKKSISGAHIEEILSGGNAEVENSSSKTEGKFIKPGAEPRRDVKVPESVKEGTKVRQFARTAAEAETLTDETAEGVLEDVEKGKFNYTPISDKSAMSSAYASLDTMGVEWVEKKVNGAISSHSLDKNTVAMAEVLMQKYSQEGQNEKAQKLIIDFAAESTRTAQSLQAISMLKKLDPNYEVAYIDKVVENLREEIIERNNKKFGKKPSTDIEVSEELKTRLTEAKTEEEREAIRDEIYTEIADQLPNTWINKWNAWRYMAMLGNARTHVRNVVGNAYFMPMIATKNIAAKFVEPIVAKVSGGKIERSKTFVVPKKYRQFATEDVEVMRKELQGGGKHNPSDIIRDKQRVFDTKIKAVLKRERLIL